MHLVLEVREAQPSVAADLFQVGLGVARHDDPFSVLQGVATRRLDRVDEEVRRIADGQYSARAPLAAGRVLQGDLRELPSAPDHATPEVTDERRDQALVHVLLGEPQAQHGPAVGADRPVEVLSALSLGPGISEFVGDRLEELSGAALVQLVAAQDGGEQREHVAIQPVLGRVLLTRPLAGDDLLSSRETKDEADVCEGVDLPVGGKLGRGRDHGHSMEMGSG